MDRIVDFDPDAKCDICGAKGANDFYGDFVCSTCFDKQEENDVEKNVNICLSALSKNKDKRPNDLIVRGLTYKYLVKTLMLVEKYIEDHKYGENCG